MSIAKEKRMVPTDVLVLRCDGPECNAEVQLKYENDLPDGWYGTRWSNPTPHYGSPPETPASLALRPGPWHFHRLACLQAWARQRAEAGKL